VCKASWAIFGPDGVVWNGEKCTAVLLKEPVFKKYFSGHNLNGGYEFLGVGYEYDEWYHYDELESTDNLSKFLNLLMEKK